LSILQGQAGARLTHSHERQFNFALQSLTLWREITDDMFRFWCLGKEGRREARREGRREGGREGRGV
jgi:hypothetical protein